MLMDWATIITADIPTRIIMKHHDPLEQDEWECGTIEPSQFLNATPEFIKQNSGHVNYGTYREAFEKENPDYCPTELYDYHIARIAWLIANRDDEPVDVDIMLKDGQYSLQLEDGNHRLVARHYGNRRTTIAASITYSLSLKGQPIRQTLKELDD